MFADGELKMQDMLIISGNVTELSRVADWAEKRGIENGLSKIDIDDLRECVLSALDYTFSSAFKTLQKSDQTVAIAIHFNEGKAKVEILDEGIAHSEIDLDETALNALGKNWQHDIFYNVDKGVNRLALSRHFH